jgi:transcriptional regulator with XRE-family HTH domain
MKPVHPRASRQPVRIGAKLRASRLAQGLTVAQVAEASGLTRGFLSRVERDETSPSVSTLITICQVLSLPVGDLFETVESDLISIDDAPLINMGGTDVIERMLTPRGQGRVQILRSVMQPGASGGEDPYTVNCDVEVLHVVLGRLRLRLGNEWHDLSAGDTMTFPGREPHTWRNDSAEETIALWTLVPAPWSGSQ